MAGRVGSRISSLFGLRSGKPSAATPIETSTQDSIGPGRRSLVSIQPLVRWLTASMLAEPRFPKEPAPPHLKAGFDYTPSAETRESSKPRRPPARRSTVVPGASIQAVLAIVAILCGFAGGLLLARALGLL
jgi:hypothetical protein